MKTMSRMIVMSLMCVALTLGLQAQVKDGLQVSAGYLYQGTGTTYGSGHVNLNGGRADVLLPLTNHFGGVFELSGVRTGNIPGADTGLTLLTYMAGPRYSLPLNSKQERGRVESFGQVLLGGTHASDGIFPSGSTVNSTANAFALSVGGGVNVGINRRVSLRVVQVDYLHTRLPNLYDNKQNSYRIGTSIVFRLR